MIILRMRLLDFKGLAGVLKGIAVVSTSIINAEIYNKRN